MHDFDTTPKKRKFDLLHRSGVQEYLGYKGDDYLVSSHKIDPPFFERFLFFIS